MFPCKTCGTDFPSRKAMRWHILKNHKARVDVARCYLCAPPRPSFENKQDLHQHINQEHPNALGHYVQTAQAFNGVITHYTLKQTFSSMDDFHQSPFFQDTLNLLRLKYQQHGSFGLSIVANGNFYKLSEDGYRQEDVFLPLRAKRRIITLAEFATLSDILRDIFTEIENRTSDLTSLEGSNWIFFCYTDLILETEKISIFPS